MFSRNPTNSSNPTPSADDDSSATRRCEELQCFGDLARRERRLDFGEATRNATPQATCAELHGDYRRLGELARSAMFPGKSIVLQRRTRDSNPQPVSRRLISSQVPNHSAILQKVSPIPRSSIPAGTNSSEACCTRGMQQPLGSPTK